MLLVVLAIIVSGWYLYKNDKFAFRLSNSSASDPVNMPDELQQKYPHAYNAIDEASQDLGPAVAHRFGQQFQEKIQRIEDTLQKSGGDRTRTSNSGSFATAYAWKQNGCEYSSIQLIFNKSLTKSSSGNNSTIRGDVYLYKWDDCKKIFTSSSGFFSVKDPKSQASFVSDGTRTASFILEKTPVIMTSYEDKSTVNMKVSADCEVRGTGFTSKSGRDDYYVIETFERREKSDNSWRQGTLHCKNAIVIGPQSFSTKTDKGLGYLNQYNWSLVTK